MLSPVSALPLRLERRPSPRLMVMMAAVHGAALLAWMSLPLAWWFTLPGAAAIVGQFALTLRRHGTLSTPKAPRQLVWAAENSWELFTADGTHHEATLLPMAYVHPWLVILRFKTDDKRRCAVILLPDSLDPDSHRRLRMQLRLQGGGKSPGE